MAVDLNVPDNERHILVRCVTDAYEALHVMTGVDENGPVLVWLADQLLQVHRRGAKTGAGAGAGAGAAT